MNGTTIQQLLDDEDSRRHFSVQEQREAGRTGGGPECPMCGGRHLRSMPLAAGTGMFLCGSDGTADGGTCVGCGYGATISVTGGGLEVKAIAR